MDDNQEFGRETLAGQRQFDGHAYLSKLDSASNNLTDEFSGLLYSQVLQHLVKNRAASLSKEPEIDFVLQAIFLRATANHNVTSAFINDLGASDVVLAEIVPLDVARETAIAVVAQDTSENDEEYAVEDVAVLLASIVLAQGKPQTIDSFRESVLDASKSPRATSRLRELFTFHEIIEGGSPEDQEHDEQSKRSLGNLAFGAVYGLPSTDEEQPRENWQPSSVAKLKADLETIKDDLEVFPMGNFEEMAPARMGRIIEVLSAVYAHVIEFTSELHPQYLGVKNQYRSAEILNRLADYYGAKTDIVETHDIRNLNLLIEYKRDYISQALDDDDFVERAAVVAGYENGLFAPDLEQIRKWYALYIDSRLSRSAERFANRILAEAAVEKKQAAPHEFSEVKYISSPPMFEFTDFDELYSALEAYLKMHAPFADVANFIPSSEIASFEQTTGIGSHKADVHNFLTKMKDWYIALAPEGSASLCPETDVLGEFLEASTFSVEYREGVFYLDFDGVRKDDLAADFAASNPDVALVYKDSLVVEYLPELPDPDSVLDRMVDTVKTYSSERSDGEEITKGTLEIKALDMNDLAAHLVGVFPGLDVTVEGLKTAILNSSGESENGTEHGTFTVILETNALSLIDDKLFVYEEAEVTRDVEHEEVTAVRVEMPKLLLRISRPSQQQAKIAMALRITSRQATLDLDHGDPDYAVTIKPGTVVYDRRLKH